jgi:hypothetical protein
VARSERTLRERRSHFYYPGVFFFFFLEFFTLESPRTFTATICTGIQKPDPSVFLESFPQPGLDHPASSQAAQQLGTFYTPAGIGHYTLHL